VRWWQVAHKLLVKCVPRVEKGVPYEELGGDYLERLEPERLTRQLVKRLEQMGHKVTLEAQPD
jgi:hypothetical protein